MTHVFIVNDTTFKIHLEYMFAGTGASIDALFINDSQYINPKKNTDGLSANSERNLVAMIADVSRIRAGDNIVFYLQANKKHQGMFFGVFKAKGLAFYKPNSEDCLDSELGKNLNFRILIEPKSVFANGVTEHELLDRIENINHPYEMCWSLIYRKLKGNRGCTMITDFESKKLQKLLEKKNKNINLTGSKFSYSTKEMCIVECEKANTYSGNKTSLDIKERLIYKYKKGHKYESHLQAYIMQNFDKSPLKDLISKKCIWAGNEVSCGVGMQRIDSLFICDEGKSVNIIILELKCVEPYESIVSEQLPWYVDWVKDYLAPTYDKKVKITPIILAPAFSKTEELLDYKNFCDSFETINDANLQIGKIHYISLSIENDVISFKKEF